MTRSEIIQAVVDNTNRSDKDRVIRNGITIACGKLFAAGKFSTQARTSDVTALAGTNQIAFPADYVNLQGIAWLQDATNTQNWPIVVKTKEWIFRRYPNVDSINASYPYIGYIDGNYFKFLPTTSVDGLLRVNYDALPNYADDTDSLTIPLADDFIISSATAFLLRSVMLFTQAREHEIQASMALQRCLDVENMDEAVMFQSDIDRRRGMNQSPIEPYLDPFQGHNRGWYSEG
jgi:hypothetical protein